MQPSALPCSSTDYECIRAVGFGFRRNFSEQIELDAPQSYSAGHDRKFLRHRSNNRNRTATLNRPVKIVNINRVISPTLTCKHTQR